MWWVQVRHGWASGPQRGAAACHGQTWSAAGCHWLVVLGRIEGTATMPQRGHMLFLFLCSHLCCLPWEVLEFLLLCLVVVVGLPVVDVGLGGPVALRCLGSVELSNHLCGHRCLLPTGCGA